MVLLSIASLLAALDSSTVLWWIDVIVKVSIALGAVIFVHELGHFLVAKACGVKCEKFMIGFDIGGYKISRRWGETEYGIGILPLGGYVKMLGQDDDPAHIAEQMQKSQIDAASTDAVPITGPNGETYYVDRRSYLAKSVPQRMAIISAGVIMNVIFAFIFAVIAFGMGVPYLPSIVSETVPGSPAWQAGIEPGDEIVQLGNRKNPTFMQLQGGITLGDLENGIPCLVRRAADGEVVPITLKPTQKAGGLATVGIGGPRTLTLMEGLPTIENSAAAQAKLVAPDAKPIEGEAKLQGGDRIVRVGETTVENYREFAAELARGFDKSLLVTVRRPAKKPAEDAETGAAVPADEGKELTFEVPARPLRQFGLIMKMGPITAVQVDSPAAQAGLIAGDVIERVDGQLIGEGDDALKSWDASSLPDYLRRAARDSREVEITVQRPTGKGDDAEQLSVRLMPILPSTMNSTFPARVTGTPMAANEVGIAYRIENEVAAVVPGTAAAAGGIAPGDTIDQASFIQPADDDGKTPDPVPVELGADNMNWPTLLDVVQFLPPGSDVEFSVVRGREPPRQVKLRPVDGDGAFVASRGFWFEPVIRTRKADSFSEQVRYGWDETVDALTMVFRFLQKLGTQVPFTALGGPGTIAAAAGGAASQGLSTLLVFLTMLSANLAVINFLPIPLLDGGHMVFLAYEGIRGRPASERIVLALHFAGFVFIISLMVFVIGLDIHRFTTG